VVGIIGVFKSEGRGERDKFDQNILRGKHVFFPALFQAREFRSLGDIPPSLVPISVPPPKHLWLDF
jgi:hypothetical protein